MNWLTNFIPPKIRSFVSEQREVPDNLWTKCVACEELLYHADLQANLNVCTKCGHHLRITVKERLAYLFDDAKYSVVPFPKVPYDPLKFKDKERYADRLKRNQTKTGLKDALTIAEGTIGGNDVVIAAFNFSFMGGSMGAAVGEGIVKAAETAVKNNAAFIVIPASGGARMQEGMLSLIQMPRTIIAVEMVKEQRLPYIVVLTDPTTGGVSASFAMVGDIQIAEPGATIGFAGKRVIKETVREELPEGFQTAEHLLEHGQLDMVVERKDMKNTLATMIGILMKTDYTKDPEPPKNGKRKSSAEDSAQDSAEKADKAADGSQGGAAEKALILDSNKEAAKVAMKQVKAAQKAISSLVSSEERSEQDSENKRSAPVSKKASG